MDIRSRKTMFLESLDSADAIYDAVSLAIDCIIENDCNGDNTPIVITSYDDTCREQVLRHVQKFCVDTYPKVDKLYFEPKILHVNGVNSEEACIKLIKLLRNTTGILFWADSPSWFANIPNNLFYVVSINQNSATRALNKKNTNPTIIEEKYDADTLLAELFFNFKRIDSINTTNITDADIKFYNECFAGLIRPIPAPIGSSYDEEITITSPDWQKLACVALRRYQSKECHDGMHWDTTNDSWSHVVAYPFIEEIQSIDNSGLRQCLVGLVTINNSNVNAPYLSTAWIHPFYRRKKLLSRLWPKLQERYGSTFEIELPNANMKAFLEKIKHAHY